MTQPPLVSFLVITYNHEPFVRAALEAAVAQTYSPLEIIVADDASTDRTYEIACEFANAYKGPHCLRLHRNSRNLGPGQNYNVLLEMARGELFVDSDGDDRSLPDRVAKSVAFYQATHQSVFFCSGARWVDAQGRSLGREHKTARTCAGIVDNILRMVPGAFGATAVFHRSLYDLFGPLPASRLRYVDRAFPLRAILLGQRIHWMPDVLVEYRQHGGGTCALDASFRPDNAFHRGRYVDDLSDNLEVLTCYHHDLRTAYGAKLISREQFLDGEFAVTQQAYCLGVTARAMAEDTPWARAGALGALQARGAWRILKRIGSRRREIFLP